MDNYEGPPPAALPPPTSIASRFSSEASIAEAAATRSAEWKAAYERLGQVAPEKEEEGPYDGRSLWEKLQEHKDKKQETFDEAIKFKNQFRALDEDEISFLDSLVDDNFEEEDKKAQMIKEELKGFRQAVISRQQLAPPPISSASSSSLIASTSTLPTSTSAPTKAPPKKTATKKKDFQKKFLAGVIVKKKVGADEKKGEVLKRKLSAGGAVGSEIGVGGKETILGNETVGKVP